MVFNKTWEAQLAMEKGAPVSYWTGGYRYIGHLDQKRKDGKFHFHGARERGTEEIDIWDKPNRFSVIE
jgi:hypothetical protein